MKRLIFLAILFAAPLARAEPENNYLASAKLSVAAFECYSYANLMGESKEANRLLNFGYMQAKKFVGAIRSGAITDKVLGEKLPYDQHRILKGPSDDFIIGRTLQLQEDYVLTMFINAGGQKSALETEFRNKNCSVIGVR